jgi:hypothetical protein
MTGHISYLSYYRLNPNKCVGSELIYVITWRKLEHSLAAIRTSECINYSLTAEIGKRNIRFVISMSVRRHEVT